MQTCLDVVTIVMVELSLSEYQGIKKLFLWLCVAKPNRNHRRLENTTIIKPSAVVARGKKSGPAITVI